MKILNPNLGFFMFFVSLSLCVAEDDLSDETVSPTVRLIEKKDNYQCHNITFQKTGDIFLPIVMKTVEFPLNFKIRIKKLENLYVNQVSIKFEHNVEARYLNIFFDDENFMGIGDTEPQTIILYPRKSLDFASELNNTGNLELIAKGRLRSDRLFSKHITNIGVAACGDFEMQELLDNF